MGSHIFDLGRGTPGHLSSTKKFHDGMKFTLDAVSTVKRNTNLAISSPLVKRNILKPLSKVASMPVIKETITEPLTNAYQSQQAAKIKRAWSWMGTTLQEIIDPDSLVARLEREEKEGKKEHRRNASGSWSSTVSDALIVEEYVAKRKMERRYRARGSELLIGDEDDWSEQSSEDFKNNDLTFRDEDLVHREDWSAEPRQRVQSKHRHRAIRYPVEDESSGEDPNEDVSASFKVKRELKRREEAGRRADPFELFEAMNTPLL